MTAVFDARIFRVALVALAFAVPSVHAADVPFTIRVNQAGFSPQAPKFCQVVNPSCPVFHVQTIGTDVTWRTVYTGRLEPKRLATGTVWDGDFSSVTVPADYRIACGPAEKVFSGRLQWCDFPDPQVQYSCCFKVGDGVYETAKRMMTEYYMYQRCGSPLGWAGMCHQKPVTLYGTDRKVDLRGGYHQSCDLRNWADGISVSLYDYLRYAELAKPSWERGRFDEELRWGCDYFLRRVSPAGYLYDCQFVPIGWGPFDYYDSPASIGAQANVVMLLARAAARFRDRDAAYAARLLETARRAYRDLLENPFYDRPYVPPVLPLPRGTQGANFYYGAYRTSATGIAGAAMAALELARVTGEPVFERQAREATENLLALQIDVGRDDGWYRESQATNSLGFSDCSYGWSASGYRVPLEMFRTYGGDVYAHAAKRTAGYFARELTRTGVVLIPHLARDVKFVSIALAQALYLRECADLFGEPTWAVFAQRALDWAYGANALCRSCINGVGLNHQENPVFGQFYPSTPAIPGAVWHVLEAGEYDMPAVGQALWATEVVGKDKRR